MTTHEGVTPAAASKRARRVPRTRTGAAWVGLTAAAVIAVALIVFLAQNTRTTEISFLWMTASTSLAVALLIAAVGSVLITLILGTARSPNSAASPAAAAVRNNPTPASRRRTHLRRRTDCEHP